MSTTFAGPEHSARSPAGFTLARATGDCGCEENTAAAAASAGGADETGDAYVAFAPSVTP